MISVIIPAHNEEAVIARTLEAMTTGARPGEIDVIVVCNGCTDGTAQVSQTFGSPVRTIVTEITGKTHALNMGDRAAHFFPRVYVDGDVIVTIETIRRLADRLAKNDVLAVSPIAKINLDGCSWPVRAYYKIRSLLPAGREGIGGSGVYALSEAGRNRFSDFPQLTADDGFVRIQFGPGERETLTGVHSLVFAPRSAKGLITAKTRSQFGNLELAKLFPELWKNKGGSHNAALLQLFLYPWLWHKLVVYCFVTFVAKHRARIRFREGKSGWLRDETSRIEVKSVKA